MNMDSAVRLTEILMGFAFIQQSLEHLISFKIERRLFLARLILAILLVIGLKTSWVCLSLLLVSLAILQYFQGPYNGGSDRIGLLILLCLCLVNFLPTQRGQEIAFAYLALQLTLSYFISGWVKVKNAEWRSGQALQDVFQFSAYPVSESLRQWSKSPKILFIMSWAVMLFELLFLFSLISNISLTIALIIAAIFHFANATLFGLNRFLWIWLAAYPSILWFQKRIFESLN